MTTRPWRKREVRAVAADVGKAHDVEIDAFLVTRTRLRRGLHKNIGLSTRSASVFAYEISTAARWLYGRDDVECKLWRASDIHPWEGVRLILNRLGEGAPCLCTRRRSLEPTRAFSMARQDADRSRRRAAPQRRPVRAVLRWACEALGSPRAPFLADDAGRAAVTQAFRARAEGLDGAVRRRRDGVDPPRARERRSGARRQRMQTPDRRRKRDRAILSASSVTLGSPPCTRSAPDRWTGRLTACFARRESVTHAYALARCSPIGVEKDACNTGRTARSLRASSRRDPRDATTPCEVRSSRFSISMRLRTEPSCALGGK